MTTSPTQDDSLIDLDACEKKLQIMEDNLAHAKETYASLVAKEAAGVDVYEDAHCQSMIEDMMESLTSDANEELSGWIDAIEYDWVEGTEGDDLPQPLQEFYTPEVMETYARVMDAIPEDDEDMDDVLLTMDHIKDFIEFYAQAFVGRGIVVLEYARSNGGAEA